MKRYNIGVNGVSGLIAQVDTPLTLSNWFESSEEREYVLAYHEYCAYMIQHGRAGHESAPYSSAYKMIQSLETDTLKVDKEYFNNIVTDTYCTMLYDVGVMLLKSSALLCKNDMGWEVFDIKISLPVKLLNYFGVKTFASLDNKDSIEFQKVFNNKTFSDLVHERALLDVLQVREDFCLQDVLDTEGTKYEQVAKNGIMYVVLSNNRIKGRIGDD